MEHPKYVAVTVMCVTVTFFLLAGGVHIFAAESTVERTTTQTR